MWLRECTYINVQLFRNRDRCFFAQAVRSMNLSSKCTRRNGIPSARHSQSSGNISNFLECRRWSEFKRTQMAPRLSLLPFLDTHALQEESASTDTKISDFSKRYLNVLSTKPQTKSPPIASERSAIRSRIYRSWSPAGVLGTLRTGSRLRATGFFLTPHTLACHREWVLTRRGREWGVNPTGRAWRARRPRGTLRYYTIPLAVRGIPETEDIDWFYGRDGQVHYF